MSDTTTALRGDPFSDREVAILRDTLAKKGYTEAEVPMLVERCGRGRDQWIKPICRLGDPIADRWYQPLPRDVAA